MSNSMRKKRELTDAEEAVLQAQIANDADAGEATDHQLAQAKSFAEAFPDTMEAIRPGRGRPAIENPRKQISLHWDGEFIEKFKSTGKSWQGRMNEPLRKAAGL